MLDKSQIRYSDDRPTCDDYLYNFKITSEKLFNVLGIVFRFLRSPKCLVLEAIAGFSSSQCLYRSADVTLLA